MPVGSQLSGKPGSSHRLAHRVDPKNNPIVQEYILPDLSTNRRGRIRQPDDIVTETDQILVMNNERFAVPEILFHPNDIGIFISPVCHSLTGTFSRSRSVRPYYQYCVINFATSTRSSRHVLGQHRLDWGQRQVPWLPNAIVCGFVTL